MKDWDERQHAAYHTLYANALPHEALEFILLKHWHTFTDEFREKIFELLNTLPSKMYREELYRNAKEINAIPDNIREMLSRALQEKEPSNKEAKG